MAPYFMNSYPQSLTFLNYFFQAYSPTEHIKVPELFENNYRIKVFPSIS